MSKDPEESTGYVFKLEDFYEEAGLDLDFDGTFAEDYRASVESIKQMDSIPYAQDTRALHFTGQTNTTPEEIPDPKPFGT